MRLILTIQGGGLSGAAAMRTLTEGSLTIGRGASNGWVLPDPQQQLSRTHCAVTAEGGRFVLTDLSSNGMFVNGASQPTERDSRIVLTDGDFFRLGDYTITAVLVDDGAGAMAGAPPAAAMDPFGGGAARGSDPLAPDPLDDPFGRPPNPAFSHPIAAPPPSLRGADPFDTQPHQQVRSLENDEDLFRGLRPSNEWQGASRSDHAPATSMAMPPPRVVAPPPGEIDFDALIGDLKMPGAAPSAPVPPLPPGADPFAALDRMPDPFGAPQAPTAAPPAAPPPMAPQPMAPQQADPFADRALDPFAAGAPAPTAPQPMAPQPMMPPPVAPSPVAPPVAVPAAAPPDANPFAVEGAPAHPTAPAAAAPVAVGDMRAALLAFLEGAGVEAGRVDAKDPAAALKAAGAVFRAMTEGVREVLISRAAIKSEMRIEQTMIAAHGNNALKFSVTPDDAVAALLTPKRPGYMAPLAATREAFNDIKQHEIAVMAGVQTALMALLQRFEPEQLEKRLAPSVLGAVLPAARKARYWDAFRDTYSEITREAEDDFQSVFGRPFAKAYTAQTRKE